MAADDTTVRGPTTLDLLKLAAVALMVVDHVGLYLYPDINLLRILGRPAAVFFGFLIGFSSSSRVPPIWVALGLGLTLFEDWLLPEDDNRPLDILISLALTRIAVPFFDRLHAKQPLLLVPAAVVAALLAEPLNTYFEYGTEVTLVALLGVAVRLYRGDPGQGTARDAVALIAIVALSLIEIRHFEFEGWEAAACTAAYASALWILSRFKREVIGIHDGLVPMLLFVGRNTLWIYAAHLVALQIAAWWIAIGTD